MNMQEKKHNQQEGGQLNPRALEFLAEVFKAMGEPSRLKIIDYLNEGERCVSEIAQLTGLSQSLVSHHLKILKSAGVVRQERRGRNIFYVLEDDHVRNIYCEGKDHASHYRGF